MTPTCTCFEHPWFVGITNPEAPENIIIYFDDCPIDDPKHFEPPKEEEE